MSIIVKSFSCRNLSFSGLLMSAGFNTMIQGKHSDHPAHWSWVPGQGCPVQGCSAKIIRQSTHLKIHWAEKHEEIVAKYYCSACDFFSKRKSNVFQHFRQRHNLMKIMSHSECIRKVEHQHNREFIDPYPLTLAMVLGKSK